MPIPEFITATRAKIGHDLMWMPGVCAVVFDDDGRVLLGKRADNGKWANIAGILEPGEDPEPGILREILEETGVRARVDRLVSILADDTITYPNGDQARYLSVTFRARYVAGTAHVADDESLEVDWFPIDGLPELSRNHRERIQWALAPDAPPVLRRN
ncbi:NUDIX hydrolase [Spelaeicoccus albus]|uniref:8-oxo-dGTP pyrophosphatase MutT (NUDIX family) n=1 Tax=Spelaeicoccus albus TaxID=1280376 RepID=A0A7Z0A8Y6_9MICO|nr:NUDIX domain-containing protein [Spelaeicoccus albus]NYI65745.1 8-oxo-dGTP pyrophosphatase MutT (NUDIX family) [Spelaeicoccus albus]